MYVLSGSLTINNYIFVIFYNYQNRQLYVTIGCGYIVGLM